jgi:tetratricopeptide (TPR) repeat protein
VHERELRTLAERVSGLTDRVDEVGEAAERAEAASTGLARSLEELVARHRKVDRTLNLNSFVAYAIFTLLLGGAFFALYRTRAGELVAERDQAAAARDAALARADGATAELARRDEAAKAAHAVWELFRDHRHAEAVAAHGALSAGDLSPSEREFFASALDGAHRELGKAAIEAGRAASKAGDHAGAAARFAEGLAHVDRGPVAIQLRYLRGVALGKLGKIEEAEAELSAALAAGAEGQGVVEARWALGDLYDRAKRIEDARREYRAFVDRAPNHPLARLARNRLFYFASLPPPRPAGAAPRPAARPAGTGTGTATGTATGTGTGTTPPSPEPEAP